MTTTMESLPDVAEAYAALAEWRRASWPASETRDWDAETDAAVAEIARHYADRAEEDAHWLASLPAGEDLEAFLARWRAVHGVSNPGPLTIVHPLPDVHQIAEAEIAANALAPLPERVPPADPDDLRQKAATQALTIWSKGETLSDEAAPEGEPQP